MLLIKHSTAAVAFSNGPVVNVARVDGHMEYNDMEYNEILARPSLKSLAHAT
jgi:hypothetical protein